MKNDKLITVLMWLSFALDCIIFLPFTIMSLLDGRREKEEQ